MGCSLFAPNADYPIFRVIRTELLTRPQNLLTLGPMYQEAYSASCFLSSEWTKSTSDKLPRCHALLEDQLSHIIWRCIVRVSFSFSATFTHQIPQPLRQDIWKMCQQMLENDRILSQSQVYLLQFWRSDTQFQYSGSRKRS